MGASDGVAMRFETDGRRSAGVRMATGGAEVWRRVEPAVGASRVLAQLGSVLVAGGFDHAADGRTVPRLEAYDAAGRRTATWRGDELAKVDSGIHAAAARGPDRLLIAVTERWRQAGDPGGGRHVLEVGPDLTPRPLFVAAAPGGAQISMATLTLLGGQLLLTYTADNVRPEAAPAGLEDYEAMACLHRRRTWVELRDLQTGQLLKSAMLPDLAFVASAVGPQGAALLAGSRRVGCEGEQQAVVVALDGALKPRTVYLDESLGASEVRALQALPDGRTFVAAYKLNLVDYAPAGAALGGGRSYSTLALTLDQQGRASAAKLLDAGADVLPNAALPDGRGGVLLGGALGGQAALFQLAP